MKEFVIIHFQVFWFCWADQSFFLRMYQTVNFAEI